MHSAAPLSSLARVASGGRSKRILSRTANRPWEAIGVDRRSAEARRWRDVCEGLAREYGIGLSPTATERALVYTAANATLVTEGISNRLAAGHQVDGDEMVRATGALTRALRSLDAIKPKGREPTMQERLLAEREAGMVIG